MLSISKLANKSMINEESEKSFFKLAEFDRLQIDKYVVEHNLSRWNLTIGSTRIKGDKIQIDVGIPYSEMAINVEETINDS
jgi:hypothetical protein